MGQWYYVDWLLGVWETILGMSPFDMQQSFDMNYVYRYAHSANLMQIIIYIHIYIHIHVCRIRFHHTDSWDRELANSKADKIT